MSSRKLKQRLAGFALPPEYTGPAPKECHLVIRGGDIAGRVTSVAYSPSLSRVIGLAMLPPELAVPDSTFQIRIDGGTMIEAQTVAVPFYDPRGERQRANLVELQTRKATKEAS
jgi:sarcosine oxidase subunit alpha